MTSPEAAPESVSAGSRHPRTTAGRALLAIMPERPCAGRGCEIKEHLAGRQRWEQWQLDYRAAEAAEADLVIGTTRYALAECNRVHVAEAAAGTALPANWQDREPGHYDPADDNERALILSDQGLVDTRRKANELLTDFYAHDDAKIILVLLDALEAAWTALDAHRSIEQLGHQPEDGVLFHLATCERCGLMLAYLVRDQVECVARLAGVDSR